MPEEMDEAAEQAKQELEQKIQSMTALDLASWWKKHYQKAGHKRLGRVLVNLTPAATPA